VKWKQLQPVCEKVKPELLKQKNRTAVKRIPEGSVKYGFFPV
jgi:hypothetical protein